MLFGLILHRSSRLKSAGIGREYLVSSPEVIFERGEEFEPYMSSIPQLLESELSSNSASVRLRAALGLLQSESERNDIRSIAIDELTTTRDKRELKAAVFLLRNDPTIVSDISKRFEKTNNPLSRATLANAAFWLGEPQLTNLVFDNTADPCLLYTSPSPRDS